MNMPEKQADKDQMMVLMSGENHEGKSLWALIQMSLETYAKLCNSSMNEERVDMTSLGDVVDTGWGDLPAEEELKAMYEKYGDIEKLKANLPSV